MDDGSTWWITRTALMYEGIHNGLNVHRVQRIKDKVFFFAIQKRKFALR